MLKVSDVKGLLVENKELISNVSGLSFQSSWDAYRKEQGKVCLSLHKERLAIKLHQLFHNVEWIRVPNDIKNYYRLRAGHIIASFDKGELLICREGKYVLVTIATKRD